MTAFTPNFDLPYPSGTDAPCDFAEQWCDFTDAVQTVIDGFQATVDRTIPAIPIARLLVTQPVTIVSGSTIPFDTVSVDTAGWVNFDSSTNTITIDRAGYIVTLADARIHSALAGVIDFTLATTSTSDRVLDMGATATVGLNCTDVKAVVSAETRTLTASRSDSATATLTVEAACFSVFWHADEASP